MTEASRPQRLPNWRVIFEVGSTVAMLALGAVLVWENRNRLSGPVEGTRTERVTPVPADTVPIIASATLGTKLAAVAVIEYADFQCPSCASFAREVRPALVREYVDTGRVMFVFKNFPLSSIHSKAAAAAQAAWCAFRQDRFWQLHDHLFAASSLDEPSLQDAAQAAGLDLSVFKSCRSSEQPAQMVEAERLAAERLQIRGTPTFYFGKVLPEGRVQVTQTLAGSRPIDHFRAILDNLLK